MKSLILFFSWQSDVKDNHKTIGDALRKACDDIRAEGEYDIVYDESTWARSGSPVIEAVVQEKIQKSNDNLLPYSARSMVILTSSNADIFLYIR